MATDIERLSVLIEANTKSYERAMLRLERKTSRAMKASSRSVKKLDKRIGGLTKTARRFATIAVAGFAVRKLQRYADTWKEAGNKMRAATAIAGRAGRSLSEINLLANESRSSLEETADLYAKLLRSTVGVAKSEEEIARATVIVNKAFKAGGASMQEQVAGIRQLAQALASGFLQGDELRSIRENAPLIAQAIAKEFETTIGGLKDLGAEGVLVTGRIFKAIINGSEDIESAFARTSQTNQDSFTRLNNSIFQWIGKADTATGVTATLAGWFNTLSDKIRDSADNLKALHDLSFKELSGQIEEMRDEADGLEEAIEKVNAGIPKTGELLDRFAAHSRARELIAKLKEVNKQIQKRILLQNILAGQSEGDFEKFVDPRSLIKFETTSAGPTKANKAREKNLEGIQKFIATLKFEAEQIGRTADQQELHNNLRDAGTDLTARQIEEITQLTFKTQDLIAEQERLEAQMDALNDATNIVGNAMEDAFDQFLETGAVDFRSVIDSMLKDLARLAFRLVVIEPLIRALTAGIGGGLGLPVAPSPVVFGGARAAGGPVTPHKSFLVGERGPELFMPSSAGNIMPRGGSKASVVVNVINNASGTEVSQSESSGPSGARQIDVVIDEIAAKNIRRAGSASNQAVQSLGGRIPLIARG